MQTIKLHIDDSKVNVFLNIINSLRKDIVSSYEVIDENSQEKEFRNLSEKTLQHIWDNKEDCVYDKYLQV